MIFNLLPKSLVVTNKVVSYKDSKYKSSGTKYLNRHSTGNYLTSKHSNNSNNVLKSINSNLLTKKSIESLVKVPQTERLSHAKGTCENTKLKSVSRV